MNLLGRLTLAVFSDSAAYDLMAQIYTDEGDYVHALAVEKIADSILRSHLNLSQQSFKNTEPNTGLGGMLEFKICSLLFMSYQINWISR